MFKHYKANTNVSINVVLKSKKNLHVTFVPHSDGSSYFKTDNEDIQKAIESHYKFGKLFRLIVADNTMKEFSEQPSDNTTEEEEVGQEVKVVNVSDLAAAKDYLADTFGICRTTLRSKKAIVESGEANGIVFEGLE